MSIIIIGILVLFLGVIAAGSKDRMHNFQGILKIAGIILILVGLSMSCVVQIEPGEVGVQKLFGKVNNNVLSSGLNFINPL